MRCLLGYFVTMAKTPPSSRLAVRTSAHALSRVTREAVAVLGQRIRIARLERKLSAQAVAERTGISRDTLHRIEAGDPGCAIGAVFEAAAVVGISLLEEDHAALATRRAQQAEKLRLLPKSVRKPRTEPRDDF